MPGRKGRAPLSGAGVSGTGDGAVVRLAPGRNCWRTARAERLAWFIDGEDAFATLRRTLIAARRRIAIVGWDLHSAFELVREPPEDGLPSTLGDLLIALLERNPRLHVHILLWDWAPIYALEREPLFFGGGPWQAHERMSFILDDAHPLAASQHQKLVSIDGRLGWCGGFDLSRWRWDTSAHAAFDPRRCDPGGDPYPPFHDLHVLVDGEAAAGIEGVFLDRWSLAGGEPPEALGGASDGPDLWPIGVEPVLRDQVVGIARTLPEHGGRAEVRESERLYLDMVAGARRFLYIENQYLTARSIRDALCRRLEDESGPDVVILLPRRTGHWLEQYTMDALRARVLERLRAADRHGRLRVYYPDVTDLDDGDCLMVHAKLMIADDEVLRIGSSNLSNRSMGLDSECDLCIVAEDAATRDAIRAMRHRLLAMFLSVEPADIAEAEASGEGLSRVVDGLRARWAEEGAEEAGVPPLRLAVLEDRPDPDWQRQLPDERIVDPHRPLGPDLIADVLAKPGQRPHVKRRLVVGVGLVVLLFVLAAAWQWTPLGEILEPERLAAALRRLTDAPWGGLLLVGGFVVASLVAVPVTLLIIATVLVFGGAAGAVMSLVSATLAALAGYGVGRWLGRPAMARLTGGSLERLDRRLARHGIPTVVTVRIVPVAPFAVINLVAGASRLHLRDFLIGTLIGMIPGIGALALFSEGLLSLLRHGSLEAAALVLVAALLVFGIGWYGRRLAPGGGERSSRGSPAETADED
ncbi:phosphatidylserine/phosphatidylglycerophosphate/cardiolipin synthase [Thioflavicoccus mobilis 8321]|uniref:Phosphatidylserine/phosphatidylglycerophosphate/ cardiolipin synthase n=1 Tax=Thioflavicoccus mobilis 8321 TaxID=765912 RepID=L0GU51_9GAMM|nr:VTT domain-containing protein [Thioflavicoccus mobilis]AGA90303.1 phosphatidylserine/phosphatidylglycerophosphate/cardiolipin synthase [Thioflavicoccus mobilis 8321]